MKKILPLFAALLFPATSQASFHFWDINEVFTNGDGTVQFIEFVTASDGQEFLATRQLASTGATTFTFPTNLTSYTPEKYFLVATSGFNAAFGFAPDYVVPNNFLTSGAGNVLNFASGTDSVNLTSLPTNGTASLDALRNDNAATAFAINSSASPINFAGVPEPTSLLLIAASAVGFIGRRRRLSF